MPQVTFSDGSARHALMALRAGVALLLIVHGIARVSLGIVDDFGGFLDMIGFPFGVALAWAITVFEIFGGAGLLAVAYAAPPVARGVGSAD